MQAQSTNVITEFRHTIESAAGQLAGFGEMSREDRADGSTLTSRFEVAKRIWIEMVIRPGIPQVRAGIMTDDRWLNEELEEAIEETGDTMPEFIESGFDEVGLEWREPVVEHYRDQGKYFVFATAFEPASLDDLSKPATVDKTLKMLRGYYEAFRKVVQRHA